VLEKEFNESRDMNFAREILTYGHLRVGKESWKFPAEYYSLENLKDILKNDDEKHFTDPGELEVRDSFQTFIIFLGKLGYLLKVGTIKKMKFFISNFISTKHWRTRVYNVMQREANFHSIDSCFVNLIKSPLSINWRLLINWRNLKKNSMHNMLFQTL